jgi:hypothetical protein
MASTREALLHPWTVVSSKHDQSIFFNAHLFDFLHEVADDPISFRKSIPKLATT